MECSNNYRITPNSGYDLTEVESTDFYKPDKRTFFSSVIMILMVVISSLGYMTLLQAAFVAAFAMIICRFCSIEQARESIDWRLLMIFAGSISLGTAIQETGIAEWISQGILVICDGSPYVALIGVCLVATFINRSPHRR